MCLGIYLFVGYFAIFVSPNRKNVRKSRLCDIIVPISLHEISLIFFVFSKRIYEFLKQIFLLKNILFRPVTPQSRAHVHFDTEA